MKICILCNGYGSVQRGSERLTEELYTLLKNDYDITIFGMKETDISIGINTKQRQEFKIPWRNGKAYLESHYFGKKWYHLMKQTHSKYNLVINNAGLGGSYWCRKYRNLTSTPFITLERGGGREEMINYLFHPDCMVFLTKVSEKKARKWYLPKVNTTTIPIGIHPSEFKGKSKSTLVKGLEYPIILSTSALVSFKRIKLIIDAVYTLGGSVIQTSDGPLRTELINYGDALLGNQFKYVGKVDRKELIKLYNSCDVFVNASRKEAFGIVYLEAMASGLSIVTQDDERRREIIGNAGEFVDCTNSWQFADAIFFASKKTYSQKQAKKYDWKILKKKYVKVIEETARSTTTS